MKIKHVAGLAVAVPVVVAMIGQAAAAADSKIDDGVQLPSARCTFREFPIASTPISATILHAVRELLQARMGPVRAADRSQRTALAPRRLAGNPETTPPMPFTEWPYGGVTPIGVTRPNSVDSPLMVAIANTAARQWMNDATSRLWLGRSRRQHQQQHVNRAATRRSTTPIRRTRCSSTSR